MKRRRVLQTLATLPAASLLKAQQPVVPPKPSPAAVEQIPVIEATIPDFAGTTVTKFFSPAQFACFRRLTDLLYPAINGVPGALEAGAPEFLDFLLFESPTARQVLYRDGVDDLERRSQQALKVSFASADQAGAEKMLAPLREPWTADPDSFTSFLRAANQDVIQATQSSHDWIRIMSKRVRSAGGVGMYWFPID
ncbi:MAG: gluconate 2-dehydrogenase subunit 3 family protein [Bryobacteraceae bacterium]